MGTQVTIMVADVNRKVITSLKSTLEKHFNRIDFFEEDLVLVCKTNKDLNYLQVEQWIHIYSDYIDDLKIIPIKEEPIEDLSEEYGFVSALDLVKQESKRYG